jgi:hypothetical protein
MAKITSPTKFFIFLSCCVNSARSPGSGVFSVNTPKPDIDTGISTLPLIQLYDNDYHLQNPEIKLKSPAKFFSCAFLWITV